MEKKTNVKLILIGFLILLTTIGGTYAWWTASTQASQSVSMGNLSITADFKEKKLVNYEPGESAEFTGTIKNTGSIPAMIKINQSGSQVKFADSADFVDLDPSYVGVSLEPSSGSYEDNSKVYWFADASGNRYLLMEAGAKLSTEISASFSGAMGNEFMNAELQVGAKLNATQVIEGAGLSEFGVSFANDLVFLGDSNDTNGFMRSASVKPGMARLQELLARAATK